MERATAIVHVHLVLSCFPPCRESEGVPPCHAPLPVPAPSIRYRDSQALCEDICNRRFPKRYPLAAKNVSSDKTVRTYTRTALTDEPFLTRSLLWKRSLSVPISQGIGPVPPRSTVHRHRACVRYRCARGDDDPPPASLSSCVGPRKARPWPTGEARQTGDS